MVSAQSIRLLRLSPRTFAPPATAIRAGPLRERLAEVATFRECHAGRLDDARDGRRMRLGDPVEGRGGFVGQRDGPALHEFERNRSHKSVLGMLLSQHDRRSAACATSDRVSGRVMSVGPQTARRLGYPNGYVLAMAEVLVLHQRCCDRIRAAWPGFADLRRRHLVQGDRFGRIPERATEEILRVLFTSVLDWPTEHVNWQVERADIVLTSPGVRWLVLEAKRPGALAGAKTREHNGPRWGQNR